jgi:FtsP/CotA-like multicopper oxidase with cupredoxin domain
VYGYHSNTREDYTQELSLHGNIIVVPSDPNYWSPVNREHVLMLGDILMERGKTALFSQTTSNHIAVGRYGNVMLVNGEVDNSLEVKRGVMRAAFSKRVVVTKAIVVTEQEGQC